MRPWLVVAVVALAACDYQPRPGSAKTTHTTKPASSAVTAGVCPITLAVDGMT